MAFGETVGLGGRARCRRGCGEAFCELRRVVRLLPQRSIERGQEAGPDRPEGVVGYRRGGQVRSDGGEVIGVTALGDAEAVDVRRIGDHAVMTPAGPLRFH